jgi:hypothetical protein
MAPASVFNSSFVTVAVETRQPDYPGWSSPVRFTFRRSDSKWETVGLDRTPAAVVKK